MSSYKFSVVRNASDTKVERMTSSELRLLSTRISREAVGRIRTGCAESKRTLPAVCWAAEFRDGKRHAGPEGGNIKASGLAFIDIDHVTTAVTPEVRRREVVEFYDKHIRPIVEANEPAFIVHVQISPSGDGLHVVWMNDEGDDMATAQAKFARVAQLPAYDDKCKDMGRMLFLTPIEDTLYDITDCLFD